MEFSRAYKEVKHIVHRTRKDYYVHGWELDDWDQEGMISLYQLLISNPGIIESLPTLYSHFKTKFRNRVIDEIRKQSNHKRRLNMSVYEDIHETGERIQSPGMTLDNYYLFHEELRSYRESLPEERKEQVGLLMIGERFKGRKQMLQELRQRFIDFN